MRKIVLSFAVILMLALCGCSVKESAGTKDVTTEETTEASNEDNRTGKDIKGDVGDADCAEPGKTDTVSGSYKVKKADTDIKNTFYVFDDSKMMILETGSYKMSDNSMTLSYGQNAEITYDITKTDDGYNLIKDSNLIPLVYVDGEDGLAGNEMFDGVYKMVGGQGFEFKKDGTVTVVTTNDCEVTDSEVTIAGSTYDWVAKDGAIELSTNKTVIMTLIPNE